MHARSRLLGLFGLCLLMWTGLLPVAQVQAQTDDAPYGEVRYAESESVRSFNPFRLETARGASDRIFSLIFEGLLHYDYTSESYDEVLAERYTEAPDRQSITLELRRDVQWHDGEPFTARDVKFTFDYIKQLAPEQVRRAYEDVTIRVVDDYTVMASFGKPAGDLLQYFDAWIIPAHLFENFAPRGDRPPLSERPIGTGPFKFRSQNIEGNISVEVNTTYWGARARLESLRMIRTTDPSQIAQMAMLGGHNLVVQVPPNEIAVLDATKKFNIEPYPSFTIYTFAYNFTHPILKDPVVRQALTYATDRQQMLDQWFNGKGHLIASPFNQSSPYHDPTVKPFPHDPDNARRLLDDAGYSDRNGDGIREARNGRKLSFEVVNYVEKAATRTMPQNLFESYRNDLAAIGVEVTAVDLPLEQYRRRLFTDHAFDIALVEWTFDPIYDVTDLFDSRSIGGNNIVQFNDAEVDALIDRFHEVSDPEGRLALMQDLQALLADACPYTFMLSVDKNAALHRELAGYRIDPYYFFSYLASWYIPEDFRVY